jgi:hypothetical protein
MDEMLGIGLTVIEGVTKAECRFEGIVLFLSTPIL